MQEIESHSVVSDSLRPYGLYSPWISPGQTTGVGSLSLLQGIFPTQGSNPGLPHFRRILYQLNHKGSQKGKKPMAELLVLLTLNWWVLASLPYHPMAPPFISYGTSIYQLLRPQTLATSSPHLSIVHIQIINKISMPAVQNIGKKNLIMSTTCCQFFFIF